MTWAGAESCPERRSPRASVTFGFLRLRRNMPRLGSQLSFLGTASMSLMLQPDAMNWNAVSRQDLPQPVSCRTTGKGEGGGVQKNRPLCSRGTGHFHLGGSDRDAATDARLHPERQLQGGIHCCTGVPAGRATIRLELFLDLLREALRRVWSVAQARVVRLEQSGTGRMSGFAAATMRFTLRNGVAREEA